MSAQMNVISKIFTDHKSYAGKTIEEVVTQGSINLAKKHEAHTLASGYLRNNNGKFDKFVEFADAFQLAPINAFSEITLNTENQLLIGGNSYKLNTYHGSYSALKGLIVKDASNYQTVSSLGMQPFNQQVKQIETVMMKDKNIVIILSNDDKLKMYSYQN